jgi:hypothetical protein
MKIPFVHDYQDACQIDSKGDSNKKTETSENPLHREQYHAHDDHKLR